MSAFAVLTCIAGIIFLFFLILLVGSVNGGQFDDLEMPPERILWEDKVDK